MEQVERSIWINAPRQPVWQAISEPEHISQWFLSAMPGVPVKRSEEGILAVSFGPMDAEFAVLDLAGAPHRLTSRSLPDRQLVTTYALTDENGGTRVTVTLSGFELLQAAARQDRLHLSEASWERALANLKAHVEGSELPFPFASVAPLFGFWREIRELVAVERSVWIAAPRERVWHALIDPQQIEQWFAPGTTFKLSGQTVGSKLYNKDPDTGAEINVQILDVVEPPQRLVLRTVPAPSEIPFITSYQLDEENQGTRLTLVYTGYEKLAERWQQMEENAFGFGMMLTNLKAHVEGGLLPRPEGF